MLKFVEPRAGICSSVKRLVGLGLGRSSEDRQAGGAIQKYTKKYARILATCVVFIVLKMAADACQHPC
jgi:hypothetical protein